MSRFFEVLARDLAYGIRALRNNRGFTLAIVLTLALGIGANTAIFSLINSLMLRTLPVRAPEQLVAVGDPSNTSSRFNGTAVPEMFSYPLYKDFVERNQVFDGLLASGRADFLEVRVEEPGAQLSEIKAEDAKGRLVSSNYFDVLGLRPFRGRLFSASREPAPGATPEVVISHAYWQRRFASDSSAIGRSIEVNGVKLTIIGVGPRDFSGNVVGNLADLWIPLNMQAQVNPGDGLLDKRDVSWLLMLGRLKPNVSLEQARASLNLLERNLLIEVEGASISNERLKDIRQMTLPVSPGGRGFSRLRSQYAEPLFVLMVLVGFVLLIACTNVANLLLARAANRQKEIGVRLALGASRARLIRQMLTESVLLAALGGAAGLLPAWWGASILLRLASNGPDALPLDVHPDPRVLAFTAVVTLATGLLFGLVPALRGSRRELALALRERTSSLAHGGGRWALGKMLVSAQVALSLLMLVGAGLFVRTLRNLETLDLGYPREGLIMLQIDPLASGYTEPRIPSLCRDLLAKLRDTPGVRAVSISENGIFSGTDSATDVRPEGFTPRREEDLAARNDQVGPRYFRTVGIPLLAGRDIDERDEGNAPKVAVINETLSRFYFSGVNPVGRHFNIGLKKPTTYTIIGVARDVADHDLKRRGERRFYLPFFEASSPLSSYNFEIRADRDPAALVAQVRSAVLGVDRNLKIRILKQVTEMIDASISEERLVAQLSGGLGLLALILAATGLYGVMSYAISRRAGEIGLRMALGAGRWAVVWMVLREALFLSVLGAAVGLPLALMAGRLVEHNIVGVSSADPLVLTSTVLILIGTAALAGYFPAAKASRIDPIASLRVE